MIQQAQRVRFVNFVNIEANTGATSGRPFQEQAIRDLSIWGGMSSSEGIINDEGSVSISFVPDTARYEPAGLRGPAAVLRWLDSLEVEYTATFFRWPDER